MSIEEIERVCLMWSAQTAELRQRWEWVQVFENKGAAMGCSNPHPHGQVWASDSLPTLPAKELETQIDYFNGHASPMLRDLALQELAAGRRVVASNDGWIAVVPFWAVWPFETLILPLRPVARLDDLTPDDRGSLASLLKALLTAYDRLFSTSFPYSMGWHGAPSSMEDTTPWILHAHVYPPLLRSAEVRKFMVGYEMLAEAQRDLTPEAAAARLRSLTLQ